MFLPFEIKQRFQLCKVNKDINTTFKINATVLCSFSFVNKQECKREFDIKNKIL